MTVYGFSIQEHSMLRIEAAWVSRLDQIEHTAQVELVILEEVVFVVNYVVTLFLAVDFVVVNVRKTSLPLPARAFLRPS